MSASTPASNGAVLWHGRSRLNGDPIVAIATGLTRDSRNTKTAAMLQTWILRADMPPHDAVRDGSDAAICGDCQLRGEHGKQRPCYVAVHRAPLAVWRAWKRGSYAVNASLPLAAIGAGRRVRLGSYGDPAAIPVRVWQLLLRDADGWTGYTHAWHAPRWQLQQLVMASVDTPAEAVAARAAGWRTFRVRQPGDPTLSGEIACPASAESGHRTTCDRCMLCQGLGLRNGAAVPSIVINAHGPGRRHFGGNNA